MPNLAETLDRLVAALAENVLIAVQRTPIQEILPFTGRTPPPALAAKERAARAPGRRKRPVPSRKTAAPAAPDPKMVEATRRLFEERGGRGATTAQVAEHLAARSFAEVEVGAPAAVDALLSSGALRDAGFRRTTGKGTAPVFVVA